MARRSRTPAKEKLRPEDDFDFMVAGVHAEGRQRLVARRLNDGDRVQLVQEPDNRHDAFAVAVTLTDGRKIGYVPRTDSEDVTACIEDGGYYVATVKKILTAGRVPVPVVVLHFYRQDQFADIGHLNPNPCSSAPRARSSAGALRALVVPLFWLLLAAGGAAIWLGSAAVSFFRWLASVKDDFHNSAGLVPNPALLITKLLLIATINCAFIIALINVALLVLAHDR
jgi:HIRAN domain